MSLSGKFKNTPGNKDIVQLGEDLKLKAEAHIFSPNKPNGIALNKLSPGQHYVDKTGLKMYIKGDKPGEVFVVPITKM